MPLKLLPNRCLLIVLKRTVFLLIILLSSYFCIDFVMGRLFFPEKRGANLGSFRFNAEVINNHNTTVEKHNEDIHKTIAAKKVPRLFLGADNTIPPTNDQTSDAKQSDGRHHRQKSVVRVKNDEPFLDIINKKENDADLNDVENMTRLIDGRMIDIKQRFEPAPNQAGAAEKRRVKDAQRLGTGDIAWCPDPSPYLIGRLKQTSLLMRTLKESDVIKAAGLKPGGEWKPESCKSRYKVAIIVPFRDRQSHLTRLIDYLVPMLKRQLIDFRFIITEQYGGDLFNKGRIMNAAFEFADQRLGVDCVIFHDVDMFPQDDRNFYGCPLEPRHIGAYVNTLGYELWYNYLVGGALAMQVDQYKQLNGYSNMFWAWGGEDDDMGLRILAHNFTVERPDPLIGRMTMLKHMKRRKTAPMLVSSLVKTSATRWTSDGLNYTSWKIIKVQRNPLYYHLYVDVGAVPDEWRVEHAVGVVASTTK